MSWRLYGEGVSLRCELGAIETQYGTTKSKSSQFTTHAIHSSSARRKVQSRGYLFCGLPPMSRWRKNTSIPSSSFSFESPALVHSRTSRSVFHMVLNLDLFCVAGLVCQADNTEMSRSSDCTTSARDVCESEFTHNAYRLCGQRR